MSLNCWLRTARVNFFKVVPVGFGENLGSELFVGILQHGGDVDALHCVLREVGDGEQSWSQIDAAYQAGLNAGFWDNTRPTDDERRVNAGVVKRAFGAGKGHAVVAQVEDDGVIQHVLAFQFAADEADVSVKARHFVVVKDEFAANVWVVGKVRRNADGFGRVRRF